MDRTQAQTWSHMRGLVPRLLGRLPEGVQNVASSHRHRRLIIPFGPPRPREDKAWAHRECALRLVEVFAHVSNSKREAVRWVKEQLRLLLRPGFLANAQIFRTRIPVSPSPGPRRPYFEKHAEDSWSRSSAGPILIFCIGLADSDVDDTLHIKSL